MLVCRTGRTESSAYGKFQRSFSSWFIIMTTIKCLVICNALHIVTLHCLLVLNIVLDSLVLEVQGIKQSISQSINQFVSQSVSDLVSQSIR